jgi:hypothetical protein
MGAGMFVVNTFPILENVDAHPAADRLLLNLVDYAAASTNEPLSPLPDDFDVQLAKIGYLSKAPKLDKGVMGAAGPERRDHD